MAISRISGIYRDASGRRSTPVRQQIAIVIVSGHARSAFLHVHRMGLMYPTALRENPNDVLISNVFWLQSCFWFQTWFLVTKVFFGWRVPQPVLGPVRAHVRDFMSPSPWAVAGRALNPCSIDCCTEVCACRVPKCLRRTCSGSYRMP